MEKHSKLISRSLSVNSVLRTAVLVLTLSVAPAAFATTEDWDCGDSSSITCDLTWTDQSGDFGLSSNSVRREAGNSLSVSTTAGCSPVGSGYTLSATATPVTGEQTGVAWDFTDANNYYYAMIDANNDLAEIYRYVAASATLLCSGAVTITPTTAYLLQVEVVGDKYSVSVDGNVICTVTNSMLADTNTVGIYSASLSGGLSTGSVMDNFECDTILFCNPKIKSAGTAGVKQLINGGIR